ncbi:MAG TPA: vWA domain-containing protein [Burkholderiaceae bacterium]|nr:vWA domain-containing protein [Burkholderiaceae bacterium]
MIAAFDQPLWLALLPLALLPLLAPARGALPNAWVALLPPDRASQALQIALRAAAVLAISGLVVALAGPYRPEYEVERVGRGAEIVLVLDRSRSMDQSFGGARNLGVKGTGPEALDYYSKLRAYESKESKGLVARRVLSEFAAKRPDDRFGMVAFSTLPIRLLEFTQKNEVIQAAINAGNIGRGLSETNIALALESALGYFDDRPYTGSRIIMLVSDGGDRIEPNAREVIAQRMRKTRVGIYWIYIRSARSPGLLPDQAEAPAEADTVPEYFLHRFFLSLGAPYHAYEAGTPEALQQAVDDVNRLENLPITYQDTIPRRDLAGWGYALALAAALALLGAHALEVRRWA